MGGGSLGNVPTGVHGKNLAEYNRKREALLTLCIEAIENGMRFESKTENTEEK